MYTHQETGIQLSKVIGSYQRGEARAYQDGGRDGVAIPYHSDTVEATIFIIRLGADSQMTAVDLVQESLDAVKQLEQDGKYSELKIFQGDGAVDRSGWKRAAFTAHVDGGLIVSLIYCILFHNQYAVKLRGTTGNPKFIPSLQDFVRAVQDQIAYSGQGGAIQ